MNKIKFYCKNCPYKKENECVRINCCLIDSENQILTLLVAHNNKIRHALYKMYEEIKNQEEYIQKNYSLEDYFSELDQEIMEITDEMSEKLTKEIRD